MAVTERMVVIESMYLLNYQYPEQGVSIGGSQRYSLDLGRLLYKNGYNVVFIAKASRFLKLDHEGWAKIIGLDVPFGSRGWIQFSKGVYEQCERIQPDLVCYSDLQIAWPFCYGNSFALQHGIAWDGPSGHITNKVKNHFQKRAMKKVNKIICVDTNFINWCRTTDSGYDSYRDKLVYIPNYADTDVFKYNFHEYKDGDLLKLFFPRRLVPHRGFSIFMDMCNTLLNKGYNVHPVLAIEEFRAEEFKSLYPQYCDMGFEVVHPNFNEIASHYSDSFLTFVPSLWSEGTSLSAIESICSGCPVIASDVGGLGNIIIPHFNGLLLTPTVQVFVEATERLIADTNTRNKMARNCYNVREYLGKNRWESDVMQLLSTLL